MTEAALQKTVAQVETDRKILLEEIEDKFEVKRVSKFVVGEDTPKVFNNPEGIKESEEIKNEFNLPEDEDRATVVEFRTSGGKVYHLMGENNHEKDARKLTNTIPESDFVSVNKETDFIIVGEDLEEIVESVQKELEIGTAEITNMYSRYVIRGEDVVLDRVRDNTRVSLCNLPFEMRRTNLLISNNETFLELEFDRKPNQKVDELVSDVLEMLGEDDNWPPERKKHKVMADLDKLKIDDGLTPYSNLELYSVTKEVAEFSVYVTPSGEEVLYDDRLKYVISFSESSVEDARSKVEEFLDMEGVEGDGVEFNSSSTHRLSFYDLSHIT